MCLSKRILTANKNIQTSAVSESDLVAVCHYSTCMQYETIYKLGSTHVQGHTLDSVLSWGIPVCELAVENIGLSDHYFITLIWFSL